MIVKVQHMGLDRNIKKKGGEGKAGLEGKLVKQEVREAVGQRGRWGRVGAKQRQGGLGVATFIFGTCTPGYV